MTDTKTTIGGVIAFVIVLLTQINNLLDSNPETTFGFAVVIAAAGVAYALISAKDSEPTK